MRRLIFVMTALMTAACGAAATRSSHHEVPLRSATSNPVPVPHADGARLSLKWETSFSVPAKLGAFSGCDHYDRTPYAYCGGLPASLRSQWWAYPYPWPDSATEVHIPLGGYYDPAHTVWISGGQMHIRLFRDTTWIHSAAVVPKAAIGLLYGAYIERFSVNPEPYLGYKSSHLLWPTSSPLSFEVDFPESQWNLPIDAHVHAGPAQRGFATDTPWTGWHTSEIDWAPGKLTFYLDDKYIGTLTGKWVPDERMSWIIQNESAIGGEQAPERSSAEISFSYLAVYSYAGRSLAEVRSPAWASTLHPPAHRFTPADMRGAIEHG